MLEQDNCSIEELFHIIGLRASGSAFHVHFETLICSYDLHYVRTISLMKVGMTDNQPL